MTSICTVNSACSKTRDQLIIKVQPCNTDGLTLPGLKPESQIIA